MRFKLPDWKHDDRGAWVCDDTQAMALAQRAVISGCGFNVPEYDAWLSAMPLGAAREAFMDRRQRAANARSVDGMLRHLEYLKVNWTYSATLLPSVQRDEKRQKGATQGGRAAAAKRQSKSSVEHAKWIATAQQLLAQGRSPRELSGVVARRFRVSARAVRPVLRKAEVK